MEGAELCFMHCDRHLSIPMLTRRHLLTKILYEHKSHTANNTQYKMSVAIYTNQHNTELLPIDFLLGLFETDGCFCILFKKEHTIPQGPFRGNWVI